MGIRKPAVAGRFYPAHSGTLKTTIDKHLSGVSVAPSPTSVVAAIVPHAGYPYSGLTAAHSFKRIQGKSPKRVVLLGCSHQFQFDGMSVFGRGGYETPLGIVPVDEDYADHLISRFGNTCPESHRGEHALEVQLPFLQVALKGEFKLVPILFGSRPDDMHREVGLELARSLEHDDLVLASTDLSHFLSEERANVMDHRSLDHVLAKDEVRLARDAAKGKCSLCGISAVVAAMAFANATRATQWQLLDYRTSAWASGDTGRVVGYGAISMERDVA